MKCLPADKSQRIHSAFGDVGRLAGQKTSPWVALAAFAVTAAIAAELTGGAGALLTFGMTSATFGGTLQAARIYHGRRELLMGAMRHVWGVAPKGFPLMPEWPAPGRQVWITTEVEAPGVGPGVRFTLRAAHDDWDGDEQIFLALYDPQGHEVAVA